MVLALDIKVKLEGDLGKEEAEIAQAIAEQIPIEEKRISRATPRTGRYARRKGRLFRRSAEGEPPADETGRFRREVSVRRSGRQTFRVTFAAPYAGILEVKLNRPFTVAAAKAAVEKIVGNDGRIQFT